MTEQMKILMNATDKILHALSLGGFDALETRIGAASLENVKDEKTGQDGCSFVFVGCEQYQAVAVYYNFDFDNFTMVLSEMPSIGRVVRAAVQGYELDVESETFEDLSLAELNEVFESETGLGVL